MTDHHTAPAPGTAEATAEPAEPRDRYGDCLAAAITALTDAARLTRTGTGPGAWTETRPVDWADFVALAVTGAAANIGSRDQILDGRPRSWEADTVRDLITRTVGDHPDELLAHRTEPLPVHLDVDAALTSDEDGRDCSWDYEVAADRLQGRRGDPPADPEQVEDLLTQLDQLRQAEWATYAAALEANLREVAVQDGVRVPLDVTVTVNEVTTRRVAPNAPAVPSGFPERADHRDLAAATADRLRRRAVRITQRPDRDPLARLLPAAGTPRFAVDERTSTTAAAAHVPAGRPPVPSPARGPHR
jgi:hypothetical protein